MQRFHINRVNIGTFLSIDFDAHEIFVHKFRDLFIEKRLVFHHMTPVTTGIADRQKNNLILVSGFLQSFLVPGIPLNWIVRMLKQIRTGLVDQAVGVLGFVIFLRGVRYRFFPVYLSISVFF